MAINIKVNEKTSEQLTALKEKRANEYALTRNKQDLVAEAVDALYKKEIKKWKQKLKTP